MSKRALFISKNLIGDALNISPSLRSWHEANMEYYVELLTIPDPTAELYKGMGVPLKVTFDSSYKDDVDFIHTYDVGKAFAIGEEYKCHITEAYHRDLISNCYTAALIGKLVKPTQLESPKLTYNPIDEEHEEGLILISPFSKSCSVHTTGIPNKTLPWHKWEHIIKFLRTLGPIGVLGGPDDRTPLTISEDEYYTGLSLNKVALMLRDAKLVVTIDNGISHLAATQLAPTVLFYPECLGTYWILPIGNPNASAIQIDPHKVAPGVLLKQAKEVIYQTLKES